MPFLLVILISRTKWLDTYGSVRRSKHCELQPDEYQGHGASERDKSWSAQWIDIDGQIGEMCGFDPYVWTATRLVRTMALRRTEAIMFCPNVRVVSFEATELPLHKRKADRYVRVKGGSKGGRERFVTLDTAERTSAIERAHAVVATTDGHMGHPSHKLEQAPRRFN